MKRLNVWKYAFKAMQRSTPVSLALASLIVILLGLHTQSDATSPRDGQIFWVSTSNTSLIGVRQGRSRRNAPARNQVLTNTNQALVIAPGNNSAHVAVPSSRYVRATAQSGTEPTFFRYPCRGEGSGNAVITIGYRRPPSTSGLSVFKLWVKTLEANACISSCKLPIY